MWSGGGGLEGDAEVVGVLQNLERAVAGARICDLEEQLRRAQGGGGRSSAR